MAQLDNTRYEMFCQGLSRGMSQTDAYVFAGFERNNGNASVLAKRPEIKARLAELLHDRMVAEGHKPDDTDPDIDAAENQLAATGTITKEWVLAQLIRNVKLARDANQFAGSNKALEMIGKEIGMFQDKPATPLTDAEKALEASQAAQAAIPVDKVNSLLHALGYDGQIDLATMTPVKPSEPAEKRPIGRPKKKFPDANV